MSKLIQIVVVCLFATTLSYAQGPRRITPEKMERIHAAKMAYITDRLALTADQSARFVPVYNSYEQEIRQTRRQFFDNSPMQRNDMDEASSRRYIDDNLDYQQKVIEIKRKYNDQFLKIISAHQLADMYTAEREFRQILMKRLEQQRHGGRGRYNSMGGR
jgi:hypothetical protein